MRVYTEEQRVASFWSKVDRSGGPDACWPWMAARSAGYGAVNYRTIGVRKAHHYAHMLVNGPIPDGMFVLHSCDNPPCCNPAHLRVGTPADNVKDARERGRIEVGDAHWSRRMSWRVRRGWSAISERKPPRERTPLGLSRPGSKNGNSKLTEADVVAIRQQHAEGRTYAELAETFNVSRDTVYEIMVRRKWKHVA